MEKILNLEHEELLKQVQDFRSCNAAQQATILKLTEQIENLQQRLDKLLRLLYGIKTEKRSKQKPETLLTVSEAVQGLKHNTNEEQPSPSKANGRRLLPADLPRVRIEHDVPAEQQGCTCCWNKMQRMGKVITEQLECKPAELYVIEHVRYKYACQRCKHNVVTAKLPPQPINKGLPGPGLLTEVILNKYQDHLPLYRQEQRFLRSGIDLPRSTLCDWVMQCATLLSPIVDRMKTDTLIPGIRIFTDDTTVPILAKGKTHTGRLWVYIGGGRESPTCIIYDYTPTRSQTAPQKFLKGYRGYCQADAYPGYDVLYKSGEIIEVACWAHARRKFTDITKITTATGLADIAIDWIGKLYEIERRGKLLTSFQRKYFRRKHSKPILKGFYRWLKHQHKKTLAKTPIGKAIAYTLNHWRALNNYLGNGILNIDNNTAERAMKTVVIGRKNWLFAGSHEGATNAAILYSLIETCKLNGINPFYYLQDVLKRLPTTLMKNLNELLPYNWKPAI
jgi:transposase